MRHVSIYRFLKLVLPALVLLGGCRRTPEEEAVEGNPILFDCQPGGMTTKANASLTDVTTLVSGQHFGVFAWDTEDGWFNTTSLPDPNLMPKRYDLNPEGLDVTYINNQGRGKNNVYSPMDQYWPRNNVTPYHYTFCAYYPFEGAGISGPTFTDGTIGVYGFTAQSNVGDMVDFCVSDVANDLKHGHTTSEYDGTVKLTFHHMLTRVQFKFLKAQTAENDAADIHIWDAKVRNVRTTGTLTATYTQYMDDSDPENPVANPGLDRRGTTEFEWETNLTPYADYEILFHDGEGNPVNPGPYVISQEDESNPEYVHVAPASVFEVPAEYTVAQNEVFLMVPQPLFTESQAADSYQMLDFWWKVADEAKPHHYQQALYKSYEGIGTNASAEILDWARRYYITYTVVIRAKHIEFGDGQEHDGVTVNVSIAPWPENDVEGYYQIYN